MLSTKRYPVKSPILKNLIKYFWVIESPGPVEICHKLLPEGNIDFILNFSSPIKYITEGKNEEDPGGFHFHGIRDKFYIIESTGRVNTFGVSFRKEGLFPFLKMPLSECGNSIVELDSIFPGVTSRIKEKFHYQHSIDGKLCVLENELIKLADMELAPEKGIYSLLQAFCAEADNYNIRHFCDKYGVNIRRMERIFNKYVGASPKQFARINRLKGALNVLVKSSDIKLTELAYEQNYYDQTHFIKDFKAFTGSTPTEFINTGASVKQIMQIQ